MDGKDPDEQPKADPTPEPTDDSLRKPLLYVSELIAAPDMVNAGESFRVSVTLINRGGVDARYILAAASAEDEGLVSTEQIGRKFAEQLKKGEKLSFSFEFTVSMKALSGEHRLFVAVEYEDRYGTAYSERAELVVNVVQPVSLGFDNAKLPEKVTSGDSFEIPIAVYNTGYAPMYNVKAELLCDGLIAAAAYFGKLEPDQSADKMMSVFAATLYGGKYGESVGQILISYVDAEGASYTDVIAVRTTIPRAVKLTDEEKAAEEAKIAEQKTLSQWWVSLLIGIAIIAVIVSVIIVTKFTRAMKMK